MQIKKEETKTIVISLDEYNDLYSDFDPRPYSVRAISDDFIMELKRVDPELMYYNYHILFVIPKERRIIKEEIVIKKRLIEFFNKEYLMHNTHKKQIVKQGCLFVGLGVVVFFMFVYIFPKYSSFGIDFTAFTLIFELIGWFLLWEGLHQIIFESKEKRNHINLYKRLSQAKITFVNDKAKEIEGKV